MAKYNLNIKTCNRFIFSLVYFTEAAGAISSESGKRTASETQITVENDESEWRR